MQNQPFTEIEQLFEKARENGGYEYLYTLVRIDGLQLNADYQDELVVLRDWLRNENKDDPVESYRYLLSLGEPLNLLQNLLNNSESKHYDIRPFMSLAKGSFPNRVWPTQPEKVNYVADGLIKAGFPKLAATLTGSFSALLLENPASNSEEIKLAVELGIPAKVIEIPG